MSKRRTSFEMEIDVEFINDEKSKEHFLESDWKDSFYRFDDLNEVAEHISYSFHMASDVIVTLEDGGYSVIRFIEGFGDFVKQEDCRYKLTDEYDEAGDIFVSYEMTLDAAYTQVV